MTLSLFCHSNITCMPWNHFLSLMHVISQALLPAARGIKLCQRGEGRPSQLKKFTYVKCTCITYIMLAIPSEITPQAYRLQ
jgi:hypothetical protein